MAQYDAEYTCGHTERVRLYGPHRGREQALMRFKGQMCSACVAADRATQSAQDAAANAAANLPDLTGSERQIAWAQTIRRDLLHSLEAVAAMADDPAVGAAITAIAQERRASWWIDHRASRGIELLRSAARGL